MPLNTSISDQKFFCIFLNFFKHSFVQPIKEK